MAKRFLNGGLLWEVIEIEDSVNLNSATGKEIDILISNIFIRYSKSGES